MFAIFIHVEYSGCFWLILARYFKRLNLPPSQAAQSRVANENFNSIIPLLCPWNRSHILAPANLASPEPHCQWGFYARTIKMYQKYTRSRIYMFILWHYCGNYLVGCYFFFILSTAFGSPAVLHAAKKWKTSEKKHLRANNHQYTLKKIYKVTISAKTLLIFIIPFSALLSLRCAFLCLLHVTYTQFTIRKTYAARRIEKWHNRRGWKRCTITHELFWLNLLLSLRISYARLR